MELAHYTPLTLSCFQQSQPYSSGLLTTLRISLTYQRRVYFKIDFIAKRNTIAPATSNAAPANKLASELERPHHANTARPINAIEMINSSRCALKIRTRIKFNCTAVGPSHPMSTVGWPTTRQNPAAARDCNH